MSDQRGAAEESLFPHKAGEEGRPVRCAAFQMKGQGTEREWKWGRKGKEKIGSRTNGGLRQGSEKEKDNEPTALPHRNRQRDFPFVF